MLIAAGALAKEYTVIKVIEDFNQENFDNAYFGNGSYCEASGVKWDSEYNRCMKVDYEILNAADEMNGISVEFELGQQNFLEADAISIMVRGNGRGGIFIIEMRDVWGSVWVYRNSEVLFNNEWVEVIVPFNAVQSDIDLKTITSVSINIENAEQMVRLPSRGTMYLDELKIIKGVGIQWMDFLNHPMAPAVHLRTEFYYDPVLDAYLGGGENGDWNIYQWVLINPEFKLGKYSTISFNMGVSKYAISGYYATNENLSRGGYDSALLFSKPISPNQDVGNKGYYRISDPSVRINSPVIPFFNSLSFGSLWINWSPFMAMGAYMYSGFELIREVESHALATVVAGYDINQNYIVGGQIQPFIGVSYRAILRMIYGQQRPFESNLSDDHLYTGEFFMYGIEGGMYKASGLNDINLTGSINVCQESTFAVSSFDSNANKQVIEGSALEYIPIETIDVAGNLIAEYVNTVSPVQFGVEYYYIGPDYQSAGLRNNINPWRGSDYKGPPPNITYFERWKEENTWAQDRYYMFDAEGRNPFGNSYGLVSSLTLIPKREYLEIDNVLSLATRVIDTRKVDPTTIRFRSTWITHFLQGIRFEDTVGWNQAEENMELAWHEFFNEVGCRVLPLSKVLRGKLALWMNYRYQENLLISDENHMNVYFFEVPFQFSPRMSIRLQARKTTTGSLLSGVRGNKPYWVPGSGGAIGGNIGDVARGDYRQHTNWMPDNYIQIYLDIVL